MERERLSLWRGIENDHYEMACAVDGYAQLIWLEKTPVLVLGDEPCQTTFEHIDQVGPVIVRWEWAENDDDVKNALAILRSSDFCNAEERVPIYVRDSDLMLFDAVESGQNADGIALCIEEGDYVLETITFSPDESISLILHRFLDCN